MGAVDDPAVVLGIDVGLSTKFKTKVLDDIGWRASQLVGDVAQVDYDSLDAVSLAFDLGLQTLHLVAVEWVGDIATNIDVGHDGGCFLSAPKGGLGYTRVEENCTERESQQCHRHAVTNSMIAP